MGEMINLHGLGQKGVCLFSQWPGQACLQRLLGTILIKRVFLTKELVG
jgi:hypothetical protein